MKYQGDPELRSPWFGSFMAGPIVHQEFDPARGVFSYYTCDVLTKLPHNLVETYLNLAQLESTGKSLERLNHRFRMTCRKA